jgi:hypothetical protein
MLKVWHLSQSKKEHLHNFKRKTSWSHYFKNGILIDLERKKAITYIPMPINNKAMQCFFGKINFVKKNCAQTLLKPSSLYKK